MSVVCQENHCQYSVNQTLGNALKPGSHSLWHTRKLNINFPYIACHYAYIIMSLLICYVVLFTLVRYTLVRYNINIGCFLHLCDLVIMSHVWTRPLSTHQCHVGITLDNNFFTLIVDKFFLVLATIFLYLSLEKFIPPCSFRLAWKGSFPIYLTSGEKSNNTTIQLLVHVPRPNSL